jgi:hypothetical protein
MMNQTVPATYTAFVGSRRVSAGSLRDVALAVKSVVDAGERQPPLIFDDSTGQVVDVDVRGTDTEVVARLPAADHVGSDDGSEAGERESPYREAAAARGRGRPKLGVVAREVTLLPRHWEWLATQPGGASAAVRRLVDAARQASAEPDRIRQAKESTYRFMSAIGGNEAGFEEATRALFAGQPARFLEMTETWPADVRDHARALAARAFAA